MAPNIFLEALAPEAQEEGPGALPQNMAPNIFLEALAPEAQEESPGALPKNMAPNIFLQALAPGAQEEGPGAQQLIVLSCCICLAMPHLTGSTQGSTWASRQDFLQESYSKSQIACSSTWEAHFGIQVATLLWGMLA
jgi:hypothetical protein